MSEIKPVVTFCEYGKVKINLRSIIDAKGITKNKLAKMTGTRFEVVSKWCSGDIERIDADVLARFCYVLDCDVCDIIKYEA
ncbi:MAG: helix-turn-helix transcriptional regulator [Clostridia bacterium]|nr:helix-turn-helix transcriptional regulator [Clostridia bacterium]